MNKLINFVVWLDGYLDAIGDDINISKTNVIRTKLNGLFEHEADKLEDKPDKLEDKPDKAEDEISLQELGGKHNFPVYNGFPFHKNPQTRLDGDDRLYRC